LECVFYSSKRRRVRSQIPQLLVLATIFSSATPQRKREADRDWLSHSTPVRRLRGTPRNDFASRGCRFPIFRIPMAV
jgi:hypothetical protein